MDVLEASRRGASLRLVVDDNKRSRGAEVRSVPDDGRVLQRRATVDSPCGIA